MSLSPRTTFRARSRRWRRAALGCLWISVLAGCQATTRSRNTSVTMVADKGAAKDEQKDGDYNIQGPTQRLLNARNWQREKETAIAQGNEAAIEGLPEYQAAEDLYKEGKYKEAEKAFKTLAKERRKSYETWQVRWDNWIGVKNAAKWDPYSNFGDPIEEDSLFMLAECQFAQKRYSYAQDSYDDLLNRYPSTRHMDHVTRQLFRIARYWLDVKEPVPDDGDIKATSGEEQRKENLKPRAARSGILPNVADRTRPTFDTDGRALQALRSIWLHDTTGPLADDALMLSANYHLRTGDFTESARLYKLLREQYPDSKHFEDAFMLGSHVTLASYQGPSYDGKSLDEAIKLKEAALRIFPDLSDEQRTRLAGELRRMYDAEVERIWDKVEFYEAKNSPKSVELYCNVLINKYPKSPYADLARKKLQEMNRDVAARGRTPGWWPGGGEKPAETPESTPRTAPPSPPPEKAVVPDAPAEEEAKPKEPRRFQFPNPLRRAPKTPDLQSPGNESAEPPLVAPAAGSASLDE